MKLPSPFLNLHLPFDLGSNGLLIELESKKSQIKSFLIWNYFGAKSEKIFKDL